MLVEVRSSLSRVVQVGLIGVHTTVLLRSDVLNQVTL